MRSIVILGLLVMVGMVSARPSPKKETHGHPQHHRRPIPCRDEFTNGTVIRVGKECPPSSNCTEGPREASFVDGTVYLRFFCDKPDDYEDKENGTRAETDDDKQSKSTDDDSKESDSEGDDSKDSDSLDDDSNDKDEKKRFKKKTQKNKNRKRRSLESNSENKNKKALLCRETFINGTIISERPCPEPLNCTKALDSHQAENETETIKFFCGNSDSTEKEGNSTRGGSDDGDDDCRDEDDEDDEKNDKSDDDDSSDSDSSDSEDKDHKRKGRKEGRRARSGDKPIRRNRRQAETPDAGAVTTPKPKCRKCRPEQSLINKWGRPCQMQVFVNGVEKRGPKKVPCKDQYQCTVAEDKTCKGNRKHGVVNVKVSYCLPDTSAIQP